MSAWCRRSYPVPRAYDSPKLRGAIFATPTRRSLRWADVAACLRALGAELEEGRAGSRVRVRLAERRMTPHRPHPRKELRTYAAEDVRAFLAAAGITPASVRTTEEG